MRAIDAAVADLRPEQAPATPAIVEILAHVGRHHLERDMAALRTCDVALELDHAIAGAAQRPASSGASMATAKKTRSTPAVTQASVRNRKRLAWAWA